MWSNWIQIKPSSCFSLIWSKLWFKKIENNQMTSIKGLRAVHRKLASDIDGQSMSAGRDVARRFPTGQTMKPQRNRNQLVSAWLYTCGGVSSTGGHRWGLHDDGVAAGRQANRHLFIQDPAWSLQRSDWSVVTATMQLKREPGTFFVFPHKKTHLLWVCEFCMFATICMWPPVCLQPRIHTWAGL